jgi:hypothetical protein
MTPANAKAIPCPTTSRRMSFDCAPSATRTPRSCSRCVTSKPITPYRPIAATSNASTPKATNSVDPICHERRAASTTSINGITFTKVAAAPVRHQQSRHAAQQRQHDALRERLHQKARARHTERETYRDLTLALERAHEKEIRDVGARYQ